MGGWGVLISNLDIFAEIEMLFCAGHERLAELGKKCDLTTLLWKEAVIDRRASRNDSAFHCALFRLNPMQMDDGWK